MIGFCLLILGPNFVFPGWGFCFASRKLRLALAAFIAHFSFVYASGFFLVTRLDAPLILLVQVGAWSFGLLVQSAILSRLLLAHDSLLFENEVISKQPIHSLAANSANRQTSSRALLEKAKTKNNLPKHWSTAIEQSFKKALIFAAACGAVYLTAHFKQWSVLLVDWVELDSHNMTPSFLQGEGFFCTKRPAEQLRVKGTNWALGQVIVTHTQKAFLRADSPRFERIIRIDDQILESLTQTGSSRTNCPGSKPIDSKRSENLQTQLERISLVKKSSLVVADDSSLLATDSASREFGFRTVQIEDVKCVVYLRDHSLKNLTLGCSQ